MGRVRKRLPEPVDPAPDSPDAGFLLSLGQLLLPIVFVGALISLDDYQFKGSGSWPWFAVKLLAPGVLVMTILLLRALADRGGQPFSVRLIQATRFWLLLFGLLIGPLSLFAGSGRLVNLYNQRYGHESRSLAVVEAYEAVNGLKNTCAERFSFRIESGDSSGAIVRGERPGSCPASKVERRFDGYSDRRVDLLLRRSWIGVSVVSMNLRPARPPAAEPRWPGNDRTPRTDESG